MDYLKEAKDGKKLASDRLSDLMINDVMQMFEDLNKNDQVEVICRIFYAGYSTGYKDAIGIINAGIKANDQDGSDTLEVK